MATKKEPTPRELEEQANAILAAADAAENDTAGAEKPAAKKRPAKKKAAEAPAEAPAVMTDEEAKKAGIVRLSISKTSAFTNSTNNTPIVINGAGNESLVLTFV